MYYLFMLNDAYDFMLIRLDLDGGRVDAKVTDRSRSLLYVSSGKFILRGTRYARYRQPSSWRG